MAWTILVENHQRNTSAKLYRNQDSCFWQEDFLKFSIKIYRKISPGPWRPCFLTNPNGLNNPGRGLLKEHFCKIILIVLKIPGTEVSDKKIFKVFYIDYIGKISPAQWRPCFLTNVNSFNNLGKGSPKEHFCKIILKSVQSFLTRRFLKFSIYRCKGKISPAPGGHVFWRIQMSWTILVEDHHRNIFLQNYIEIDPVVSDKKIFKDFYIDI